MIAEEGAQAEPQPRERELRAERDRLERQLERYRALFEEMPDGYLVTDLAGYISEANLAACQLLDRPRDRLVGRPLAQSIVERDRPEFEAKLLRIANGGPGSHLIVDLTVADGRLVPVVVRAVVGEGPADALTIKWLIHDRREELQAHELRSSEERLRSLLDTVSVGVVLCDRSGDVVYANRHADRLLRPRTTGGRPWTWLEATHLDDLAEVSRLIRAAYERGEAGSLRHRLASPDGLPRWVAHSIEPFAGSDGEPIGYLSTLIDVTHEQAAIAALRESRDFTSVVIDNVSALVVVLDPQLRIQRFNRAAEQVTGYAARQIVGRNLLHTLIPVDQRSMVEASLSALLPGASARSEGDWLTSEGRRRRISWTFGALTGPEGALRAIVGTGIDVTDQQVLEAQLARADRFNAVGRLAAGVAHDINNTLTVLGIRLERLEGRHADDPASANDFAAMQRSLDHTQSLISDLLTFSSRQSMQSARVQVNDATVRMFAMLSDLLGPDITTVFALTEADTAVSVDPTRFDQAITNLAINAKDAMAGAGTLTVTTAVEDIAAESRGPHHPPQLTAGSYVRLTIADTGAGIASEHLAHIFDPYFTTKPAAKGTGLGLAVTYGTVTQSGGAIAVESEVGKGSAFTIWLPHLDDGEEPAAARRGGDG